MQGAFSFWKLMPLLLSRWCSQTLQKFHQRENYIKIILQTQTTLTPHLRILYFHLPTSYKRQLKVICVLVQRMQFSQFSANFTILMRFHNVLAKLHSLSKFQEINVEYKRVKRQRDKETWGTNIRAGWFGIGSQKVTAFGKLWAVTVIWPLGYMDIHWLNPLYCRLLNICVEPQIRALLT